MAVFLYRTVSRIDLTESQPASLVNWNLPMDRCDFKIFTGVDTKVEFAVRNLDRKPIVLAGRTLRAVIADRYTNAILGQVALDVINANKGLYQLTLLKTLTANWPISSLAYSVVVEETDGTETLLFVDQNQTARGFCEVIPSLLAPDLNPDTANDYDFPRLPANLVNTFRIQLQLDNSSNLQDAVFHMQIRTDRSTSADLIADLTQQNGGLNLIYEDQMPYLDIRFGPLTQITQDAVMYYEITVHQDNEDTVLLQGNIPFDAGVVS